MIGMQMSGFQDIYEVTENLGESLIPPAGISLRSCPRRDVLSSRRARIRASLLTACHLHQPNQLVAVARLARIGHRSFDF